MKKTLLFPVFALLTLGTTGCDYFKNNKDDPVKVETVDTDWSCGSENQLQQLKASLKQHYLQMLDRDLRAGDYYNVNQDILQKIQNGIRFEIKNIRTVNDAPNKASQLTCESQLIVHLPKGLQKRAENAYLEYQKNCDEGCDGGYPTLHDYLGDEYEGRQALQLNHDQLAGKFNYYITKTDKEGILAHSDEKDVLTGLVFVTIKAVQYAAYIQENHQIEKDALTNEQQSNAQTQLAQKAMDIRQKELDADKTKAVEKLALVWNNLSEEQRSSSQTDQKQWVEKRDVDCQVISQKSVYDLSDEQKETYQKHSNYWTEAMRNQNQTMQYTKCFTQRTTERTIYLQNTLS
ncbi:MAG: DUF1311 domain-containing protein [Acinetobacter sp.]|jgi:outer membrane lipopolysaccharide assembly protein LptE/RlpB|nr:MAG: DUF1311 domain-containing protein [Acinetobacter sp.]